MTAAERFSTSKRRWAAAAVPAAIMVALSGCTNAESGQASPPVSSAAASADGDAPAAAAAGQPARFQAVEAALTELVAAVPSPSRDAVRDAYAGAGFSPDAVEVSQDGTPTGLDVDSLVSAAVEGTECIIAEIREGKLTLTTMPALSNGQCLLGDDR